MNIQLMVGSQGSVQGQGGPDTPGGVGGPAEDAWGAGEEDDDGAAEDAGGADEKPAGKTFELDFTADQKPGVVLQAFPIEGKAPPFTVNPAKTTINLVDGEGIPLGKKLSDLAEVQEKSFSTPLEEAAQGIEKGTALPLSRGASQSLYVTSVEHPRDSLSTIRTYTR